MKTTTRAAYAKRIEAVLEHIHAHPDADLDLARLADVAFMSPYHFHRVYVAMSAAMSGRPTSASSTTPPKKGKTMFDLDAVVIQDQPEVQVLALEHTGTYQTIGRSFEKLMAWTAGQGMLDAPMRCFALYYDDPMSKPAEQLRSEACLAIERAGDLASVAKGDVHALTIRGGRCATYLFKGPYSDLDKPYRWLYDTWLEHSGEELAFEPPYEEYLNDARSTPPPELLTRICLPLKA
jgi:AraC family transcriptional regulator